MSVQQEPQQKGRSGSRQAAAFREAARRGWVSGRSIGWPRAPLALDLMFRTTRKQPPRLERLAKHYLDLLEVSAGDAEAVALYPNDRKVRLLFVRASHAWRPEGPSVDPGIDLICRTRADAIADSEAARALAIRFPELDDWDDEGDGGDWDPDDLALDLGDHDRSDVSPQLAAKLRLLSLRSRQERFLRENDRHLTFLFRHGARDLLTGRVPQPPGLQSPEAYQALQAYRALQADLAAQRDEFMRQIDLMHVRLPPLPTTAGSRAEFRDNLRAACEEVLGRFPLLAPLAVPLRVTMLVVPGLGSKAAKDLDNIALDVLPAIQEVFEPPLERIGDSGPPLVPGLADCDQRSNDVTGLLPERVEITSFQVIELRRRKHHPPEGFLRVVLGDGQNMHSLWTAAAQDVDRFLDRLE